MTIAYGIALQWCVWQVGATGISAATDTVPYWDFSNLWGGARLASTGHSATLFNTTAYRHELARLLGAPIASGEWSYPPTMLLLGVPLSALPVASAYVLWTTGTVALYALVVRGLHLPHTFAAFAIFSPALAWNIALGQNGALTGALLLAGLLQVEHQPWLGGALLGCLIVKPHMAVLVPVALIAQHNGRALAAATLAATTLITVSIAVFGWEAWYGFFTYTGPMMRRLLEAPFPQGYDVRSVTTFVLARALGLGVSASYLAQAGSAALAMGIVWRSARWLLEPPARAAIVISLTFLATPYSYTYDMVALAAPLALLLHRRARLDGLIGPLALAIWLVPCMPLFHFASMTVPLAPVLLLALVLLVLIAAADRRYMIQPC